MASAAQLGPSVLETWGTNHRVTAFLVEQLPAEVWPVKVPGAPGRTVRMLLGHLHNARCGWIKKLGGDHGIAVPKGVDRRRVSRMQLTGALERSNRAMLRLLRVGIDHGGAIPITRAIPWFNLPQPLDVTLFLAYFVSHEAHHRGQVVMLARQAGHRLPSPVVAGLWQWSRRLTEARAAGEEPPRR